MPTFGYKRYRTRGRDYELINVTLRGTRPGKPVYQFKQDRCLFELWEAIWDNPGKRRDFHACKHVRYRFVPNRIQDFTHYPDLVGPGGYPCWTCRPFWVPASPYLMTRQHVASWLHNSNYDRGSSRWNQFMANAFNSITEQVPEVIDVPNLLRDVFTLKGLLKQCGRLILKVRDLLYRLGGFAGHFSHLKTLRRALRDCSNGFLVNEFGVKPLIREIESLFGGISAIFKRIDFLRKTQGSVFTARYTESVRFTIPNKQLALAGPQELSNATINLMDVNGVVKYACSAKVQNNLVGLDEAFASAKMFLAALGGQSVASFLWDLVPFSFVVDWFFSISKLLDRYASWRPFDGELKVLSAGTSFKKVVSAKLVVKGPSLPYGSLDYGTLFLEEYERTPGLDRSLNLFQPFSALTPKQLGILSALVLQRVTG